MPQDYSIHNGGPVQVSNAGEIPRPPIIPHSGVNQLPHNTTVTTPNGYQVSNFTPISFH